MRLNFNAGEHRSVIPKCWFRSAKWRPRAGVLADLMQQRRFWQGTAGALLDLLDLQRKSSVFSEHEDPPSDDV